MKRLDDVESGTFSIARPPETGDVDCLESEDQLVFLVHSFGYRKSKTSKRLFGNMPTEQTVECEVCPASIRLAQTGNSFLTSANEPPVRDAEKTRQTAAINNDYKPPDSHVMP